MAHLLWESALRAVLIALGTVGVLGLLRVKSAAARHAAWAGVLGLMLLLPAWIAWGPRASLRVLPARTVPAAVSVAPIELPAMAAPAAVTPLPPAAPSRAWNWPLAVYLTGVLVLLVRLAVGTWRAHKLTSQQVAAPITVGLFHPTVILPDSSSTWSPEQLAAVLAHEGEHVRRRDPLVEWLALLNRAIFWFHPLAWWLERHLNTLAEEACDAAVLARGHDPSDYSAYLLELARSVSRSGARIGAIGMAMPGSSLPQRLRRILANRPAPRLSRARAVLLALACGTLSVMFAAASVDRQASIPEPPLPPAPPVAPMPAAVPIPAPAPSVGPQPHADGRLLVFFFDVSMNQGSVARAVSGATKFLEDQVQPADLVAIMTWDISVLHVVEDFTNDRQRLAADLDQVQGLAADEPGPRNLADGLRQAVTRLGVLHDRKELVYFSTGRPVGQQDFQPVVDAAIQANVAFYPVNVSDQLLVPGEPVTAIFPGLAPLNGTYQVDDQGMVTLPIIGGVKAAGLTAEQLQNALTMRFAVLLKQRRVRLYVGAPAKK